MAAPLAVMSGLAVVVAAGDRIRIEHQYVIGYAWAALMILPAALVGLAIVIQPWIFAIDLRRRAAGAGHRASSSPRASSARTGKPLEIVAGDLPTAALISLDRAEPAEPLSGIRAGVSAAGHAARDRGEGRDRGVAGRGCRRQAAAGNSRQFPNLVAEVPQASRAASRAACR